MIENSVPTPANGKRKVFDDHNPPTAQLLNVCVHCGFCLPTCPTYVLWGKEMDSPRGRVYLTKMALQGELELTDVFASHFDHCLGCQACLTSCPSGVEHGRLIEAMRGQVGRLHRRRLGERVLRWMIKTLIPYPSRLRKLALPLRAYQRTGLQSLSRALGITSLLPASLEAMDKLLPKLSSNSATASLPTRLPAQGEKRCTVAMLTGCVQSVFFSDVNAATMRVLAAEGCEVIVPPDQGCCGALMFDLGGEEEKGLEMARRLIDCVGWYEVDAIVLNSACGAFVKDYGHLLRDDPQYRDRARAFSAKCKDLSEILVALKQRAPRHPIRMRVAYHDPCHLQHAQGVREQPRAILRRIPELEVIDLPEAAICCGSAGVYNIVQPTTARELGRRKAQNIETTDAKLIITANPGCQMQIYSSLKDINHSLPVMHYVQLLDASIRGSILGSRPD